MGIRAHRVKVIEYTEQTLFKLGQSKLGDFIMKHDDTTESDGGGQIETQFHVLEEALESADELGLDDFEIETLKDEIKSLKDEGKKDDYIIYHLF
jgi:hypothetical protein